MVTIAAKATDNIGVASMTLYVDNAVVATTNLGSISYKWNTKKVASGSHTIVAKAKDAAGNVGSSATITVNK
jgi:hypothetical protein